MKADRRTAVPLHRVPRFHKLPRRRHWAYRLLPSRYVRPERSNPYARIQSLKIRLHVVDFSAFEVCLSRIERASARLNDIAGAWNDYIDGDPFESHAFVKDDGTGSLWIEQVRSFPQAIALDLGEFLYHARAALDAVVYEAACLNTGRRPPPHARKLEFPVCPTYAEFKKSTGRLEGLTADQREFVETIQPYNQPADLEPAHLPLNFNRALSILHDWARKDRHRRLHVAAALASAIRPQLRLPSQVEVLEFEPAEGLVVVRSRSNIAKFVLSGWRRGMELEANPNLMLDLVVDEEPPPCHPSDILQQRCRAIIQAVGFVVQQFADRSSER